MPRTYEDDDWRRDDDAYGEAPCPYCGETIPHDAPRCPYCENYISAEDIPQRTFPWWIIIGFLLAFFAAYRWVANP